MSSVSVNLFSENIYCLGLDKHTIIVLCLQHGFEEKEKGHILHQFAVT
jgi:hypothetical protein